MTERYVLDSSGSEWWQVERSSEQGNKPCGSHKAGEAQLDIQLVTNVNSSITRT
jgi:hypothetical protein